MHVILSQLSLTSVENVLNKKVRKMFFNQNWRNNNEVPVRNV